MSRIDFQNDPPTDEEAVCTECDFYVTYGAEDAAATHALHTGHNVEVALIYNRLVKPSKKEVKQ